MNPLNNPVAKPRNATATQNLDTPVVPKTHNPFNLTRPHFTTEQFGRYNPFRCIQVTPGDHIPLGVSFDVNSETLKSPLLSELHKRHDYFYVPMHAIMPNTWDYIIRNPSQGDDVPEDANCYVDNFTNYATLMMTHLSSYFGTNSSVLTTSILANYLRYAFLIESMLSSGSILSRLGYNYSARISIRGNDNTFTLTNGSIDDFFDIIYGVILKGIYVNINLLNVGEELHFTTDTTSKGDVYKIVTPSVMISLLRENASNFSIYVPVANSYLSDVKAKFASATGNFAVSNRWSEVVPKTAIPESRLNLGAVLAYNLCCAQYFVNTKVDYIYNCDLYRETMRSLLLNSGIITTNNMMYPYNGHSISYDVFSNHYMQQVFAKFNVLNSDIVANNFLVELQPYIAILANIFSLQTSLYYGDYFTGARPRPIGIGDSDYEVKGNTIDMVMLARKQMLARYLYTVGRIGNDTQDQLSIISGSQRTPDFHFPQYIDSTDNVITGFQVGNTTSENQGAQVTRLDSGDNTFATTLDISQHGYVLCVSSFYMPRSYSKTKDRHFFQKDRFDIFNEMLQFGGDQELYQAERNDRVGGIFGYHSNCEEYKQTFPQASGAFRDLLASWAYVVDADTIYTSESSNIDVISPSSIRVLPSEFDVFMSSMPYLSLGHNFHFIVKYSTNVIANRQMLSNPEIFSNN